MNDLQISMQELAKSMTVMNYDYASFKKETAKRLDAHDEILQKRVYITSGKARTLQEKVKEKVKTVCDENKISYKENKSKIFPRVWSKIKAKYDVANYRELPELFWKEILEYLNDMTINVKDIVEEKNNDICKI